MSNGELPAGLEARITELEQPENQGEGFSGGDWMLLLLTGVILPAALLYWGWTQ
jgi:hypothetical protein